MADPEQLARELASICPACNGYTVRIWNTVGGWTETDGKVCGTCKGSGCAPAHLDRIREALAAAHRAGRVEGVRDTVLVFQALTGRVFGMTVLEVANDILRALAEEAERG